MDRLESQVKAQSLEASASKDLHRRYREAEAEKIYLVERVEIKSTQTEQAIFVSQKLLCRLSKVEEEKVNIESQVRNEQLQKSF